MKIYITENSCALKDMINRDGAVLDDNRIDYLTNYLYSAHQAIQEGVPVAGYYIWSFMDNFEWAEGHTRRFGIVYVDYPTQRRIVKKSGAWYREVIRQNGFEVGK